MSCPLPSSRLLLAEEVNFHPETQNPMYEHCRSVPTHIRGKLGKSPEIERRAHSGSTTLILYLESLVHVQTDLQYLQPFSGWRRTHGHVQPDGNFVMFDFGCKWRTFGKQARHIFYLWADLPRLLVCSTTRRKSPVDGSPEFLEGPATLAQRIRTDIT